MEGFFLFLLFAGFVLGIVFIVTTLSRLKKNERMLRSLRQQIRDLRTEIHDAGLEPEEESSELKERFDEAKERALSEPEDDLPAGPPPLPSRADVEADVDVHEAEDEEPPPIPLAAPEPAVAANSAEPKYAANEAAPAESPPSPQPVAQPRKPRENKLRPILEKLYLWPPSGDDAAEATILGWWLSRIGLILLIIAATFGGLYVSKDAPPILRVLALSGISIGVVVLGLWLEKRLAAFGRLISAGGLGLGYFTSFGAFALPALKVIESVPLALAIQAVVVVILVAWSLWKNDEVVGAMAVLLGYVSCFFSYRHDELHFVLAGVMLLGAASAFLLWKRDWLWAQGIGILGTWGGFLLMGLFEWADQPETAPAFALLVVCLAVAALIFEAAHFLSSPRHEPGSNSGKWIKRLSILSSSLAIVAGYLSVRAAYPDLAAWFFLTFSVLMLGFAFAHFRSGKSVGLDQLFFLKSMGLLCLFFVEYFDGPVRWLSISLQAGAVLWSFYKTRYRWVEIAFWVFFAVAGIVILHGIFDDQPAWLFYGVRNLVGITALTALSFWIAIHRAIRFPDSEKPAPVSSPWNPLYLLAAGFLAVPAISLALVPWIKTDALRPVSMAITGLFLAAPLLKWPRIGPVLSLILVLSGAFITFLVMSSNLELETASSIGLVFTALAIGIAELVRKWWMPHWHIGNGVRSLFAAFGLLLFLRTCSLTIEQVGWGGAIVEVLCLIALAALGVFWLWRLSIPFRDGLKSNAPASHLGWQWGISVWIGLIVGAFGAFEMANTDFQGIWVMGAGVLLFAASFLTRNPVPAVAGGFPLGFGLLNYLDQFKAATPLPEHLLATVIGIVLVAGTAVVLWRFTREMKPDSTVLSGFELALHAIALLVLHWFVRNQMDVSQVFFANAALAVGLILLARIQPMRGLHVASGIPILYAALHAFTYVTELNQNEIGADSWWWFGMAPVLVWIWLATHRDRDISSFSPEPEQNRLAFGWPVFLGSVALAIAVAFGITVPWNPVGFAAAAVIIVALWRWQGGIGGNLWSWFLLLIAFGHNWYVIIEANPEKHTATLIATSLTGILALLHGVIFPRSRVEYRRASLLNSLPALLLCFFAFFPGVLGVDNLTTVFWGIASIVVFATGLIAGLRVYRIVGLGGLVFCIGRIFLVDIQDTFYRILAFFAIAVVMLVIGYLYHRFRDRIENFGEKKGA
ncbi:MAG: DUF2339 domain-containing protein [Verrucomicrobiales bacterium]|nr:DUF2339 domain-containing protein [Verrucomicrobiales bacterium]